MLHSMNIFVDPKTIAEQWDSYWLGSILVEHDISNDPQIRAYYERRRAEAEKASKAQQERNASRQRAGEQHLYEVEE